MITLAAIHTTLEAFMVAYNLNTSTSAINIAEDVRNSGIVTTVPVTTTSVVALPANPLRVGYMIFNAGANTVFLKEGATVSNGTHSIIIPPGCAWEEPMLNARYLGPISVITTTGPSSLQVTEMVVEGLIIR